MPTIDVKVRNNIHSLTCSDGEETRLKYLVSKFNKRIDKLTKQSANVDDKTLYLIIGLMLIDELEEAGSKTSKEDDAENLEFLNTLASRLKSITEKLA